MWIGSKSAHFHDADEQSGVVSLLSNKRRWMNHPNSGQKRSVIVGATGMVGGYSLRYALEHYAVTSVTAIVRRKLGIPHSKLSEVFHRDLVDCSALAQAVSGQDAAIFCLEPRKEPNFSYRLFREIYPAFRLLFPNQVIRAESSE
jgi:hypothetical protein